MNSLQISKWNEYILRAQETQDKRVYFYNNNYNSNNNNKFEKKCLIIEQVSHALLWYLTSELHVSRQMTDDRHE